MDILSHSVDEIYNKIAKKESPFNDEEIREYYSRFARDFKIE